MKILMKSEYIRENGRKIKVVYLQNNLYVYN